MNYFLNYLEALNVYTGGIFRVRYAILMFCAGMGILAFVSSKRFTGATRVINTFLITFIVTSVFFSNFSFAVDKEYDKPIVRFNSSFHTDSNRHNVGKTRILFIVLDEYASGAELAKYRKKNEISSFNDYLSTKGFSIIERNFSTELLTENAINQLFNRNSGFSFSKKDDKTVSSQLREATVIKELENQGYKFSNFGFFNLGNHKEYYYLSSLPRNDYEILLRNSMYYLIVSSLTVKNLTHFTDFQIYSDYNKTIYSESLSYLNTRRKVDKEVIYVHFMMPHHPFYSEKEFEDRPVTLDNYIAYWDFTNSKIATYLASIRDLNNYKIVITGDHGYRSDKRLDPHITTSAFYNFEPKEVQKISSVQDIGELLINQ